MAENTDDVKKLFEQLKCNKTVPSLIPIVEPSAKEVDCTTLLSLLLYCDVDKIDPLFFSTISKKVKQLQNTQSTRLNYEEFQKLFDFSNLNLSNLSQQELASVSFSILAHILVL